MATLTLSYITKLSEAHPTILDLQLAITTAAKQLGEAAEMRRQADEAFDIAVDEEAGTEAKNDLAKVCELAEAFQHTAYMELDAAKLNLLVNWN